MRFRTAKESQLGQGSSTIALLRYRDRLVTSWQARDDRDGLLSFSLPPAAPPLLGSRMTNGTLPIFISYAHYDNESEDPEQRWLDRLLQFLRPLELEDKISAWSDARLRLGENWRTGIRDAMEPAQVVILLVSPAFLASEFIRSEELPKLLRRADPPENTPFPVPGEEPEMESAVILPILIRPCLIEHVSFRYTDPGHSEELSVRLSDFQYVPTQGAMNGLSQHDQDLELKRVALRILDALPLRPGATESLPQTDQEELDALLAAFLRRFESYYFNAARIRNWGSKQSGYGAFSGYSTQQIEAGLSRLSALQLAEQKPGKKSTIYKIA